MSLADIWNTAVHADLTPLLYVFGGLILAVGLLLYVYGFLVAVWVIGGRMLVGARDLILWCARQAKRRAA